MPKDMMQKKSVIVIGGGLGGLFSGSLLAKNGINVIVLEKNSTIGGGLQTFVRFGETYDTGMHVISGMHEGCNIRRLCDYLDIYDETLFKDVDDNCADNIYIASDGMTYKIGAGKTRFIASLSRYFPHQRECLMNYVTAMYEMVSNIPLFNLRHRDNTNYLNNADFLLPVDDFIAKYITDRQLQGLLSYLAMTYAGECQITPAYVHALVSVFYLMGPCRFSGGSFRLAEKLACTIEKNGGQIFTNEAVCHIHNEGNKIVSVETNTGRCLSADYYISDINPQMILQAIDDEHVFKKAFRDRLNHMPMTYSAFTINLKFRPNSFRYLNHTGFYFNDYDAAWKIRHVATEWPQGFLYMTPPEPNQGKFCQKMIITVPMPWTMVKKWEDTRLSQRTRDYYFWKKLCLDCVLDKMQDIFPGIRNCIEAVNTASPLTIRDYYGTKEGAMCGYKKNYKDIARTELGTKTKLQNLFMTGQSVNLHGFCGVPLTAIQTSEEILGENFIIDKL